MKPGAQGRDPAQARGKQRPTEAQQPKPERVPGENPLWTRLATATPRAPTTLAVGAPGDPSEAEADRAADRAVRAPAARGPGIGARAPGPEIATGRGVRVQRQAASPDAGASVALLVDDEGVAPGPAQMRLRDFLAEVRAEVCRAVEALLAPTGRTTADCPYLDLLFPFLERRSAAEAERTLRRFAPELHDAPSARSYIPFIVARVRDSTAHWLETGEITGLPEGLPTSLAALARWAIENRGAAPTSPPVLFKAAPGGASAGARPEAVQARLGTGDPLAGGLRGRMETAFGVGFSHVRVHTDPGAATLSSELNARAFAVGDHVAFGPGEYRPGTLAGDALIAHELAHVIQQRGPGGAMASDPEQAADRAAAAAMLGREPRPGGVGGLRLQRCSTEESGYDPGATEEYHEDPPTPEEMIARHTTALGDLDEDALGKTLALMAWYTPRHHDYIRRVFVALESGDRDDVAAAMIANTQDSDLVDIARTPEGRALLSYIVPELTEGWTWPGGDTYAAVRALRALSAHQAAQDAVGAEIAQMRATVGATGAPAEAPVDTLTTQQIQERLRLVEVHLTTFEERWSKDAGVMAAITEVRGRISTARASLDAQAPAISRSVQIAQQVLETCELVIGEIDRQIEGLSNEIRRHGTEEANIELLQYVRARFVEALGAAMGTDAPLKLAQAGAALHQLSLSQAALELAVLQNRPGLFSSVEPKLNEMRTFAGWVMAQLRGLEAEARGIREAEQKGTDVSARRAAAERKLEGLMLSHRVLANWEVVIQVAEALESSFSFTEAFYGHDVDVDSLNSRLAAMSKLATSGDFATLRTRIEGYEKDPEIVAYYEDVPAILRSSGIVVAIGVMIVTIVVTWGVGSFFAPAAGAGAGAAAGGTATTITAGGVAAGVGASLLDALVFTSVHRGLSEVTGLGAHGSFFEDFLWNFGLFGILRFGGMGLRAGLQARGLARLARPLQAGAGFLVLEAYGVTRFRVEEGRFPSARELASMTAQTVVILAAVAGAHMTVSRLSALGRFQARWGSQFEEMRLAQRLLQEDAQRALAEGRADTFASELKTRGQALEARLKALVDQVIAEGNIEALRTQLDGILGMEASQAALTESMGFLPEVQLRTAGTPNEFSYRHGETVRLSEGLRGLGSKDVRILDVAGRPRVVEARFADRQTLYFAERAPEAAPAGGGPGGGTPAEPPASPAEQNARRLEAAKEALTRRRIPWSRVPEDLRDLERARPRGQTKAASISDTTARLGRLETWIKGQADVPWQTGREARIQVTADAARAEVARLPRGGLRSHLEGNARAAIVFGAFKEGAPASAPSRMQAFWDAWTAAGQEGSFSEFVESRLVEEGVTALRGSGDTALAALLESDGRVQNGFGRLGYDAARLRAVYLYHEHGYAPGAAGRLGFAEYVQHEVGSLQGEGRSWAERRGNLAVPIPPGGFEPLRTRLTELTTSGTLTTADAQILWRWNAMIEGLINDSAAQLSGVAAGGTRATAVLDFLLRGIGKSFSETTYREFRLRIRGLVVDDILFVRGPGNIADSPGTHNGAPIRAWGEQLSRLETWEGRVPSGDSATIGALWTAYAKARFELGLPATSNVATVQTIPNRPLRLPDGRMGDAALRFGRPTARSDPAAGDWAADYKGGADPFDMGQARNYSANLTANSGKFVMGGQSYSGLLFIFRSSTAADTAAGAANAEGLHANLKVGYFDSSGGITWLR